MSDHSTQKIEQTHLEKLKKKVPLCYFVSTKKHILKQTSTRNKKSEF